jgi:hypothetical protein
MDAVIVISLRKGSQSVPANYTPVRIDRQNHELGNPHVMKGKSMEERKRVV